MSPNAPLTDEQRNAVKQASAMYHDMIASIPLGTAESVEERARHPDQEGHPVDVTVHIEIAPPCSQSHPLLDNGALKKPERVPIYFFALRDDQNSADAGVDTNLADTHVIFFIHGGGNITGHPTHLPFIQFFADVLHGIVAAATTDASNTTRWVVAAPSYRLATVPENTFPAALQDLVAAYDYVLSKGYRASNLFVAGDSAGGSHAITLTHLLQHADPPRPVPRGVISIAPNGIPVCDSLDEDVRAQVADDVLDVPMYQMMERVYAGGATSPVNPLMSCAFLPFAETWPRTLILVGTGDRLVEGGRELARRLAALGRPVELVEYMQRPHGWWVMPQVFPENIRDAVERIVRFVLN